MRGREPKRVGFRQRRRAHLRQPGKQRNILREPQRELQQLPAPQLSRVLHPLAELKSGATGGLAGRFPGLGVRVRRQGELKSGLAEAAPRKPPFRTAGPKPRRPAGSPARPSRFRRSAAHRPVRRSAAASAFFAMTISAAIGALRREDRDAEAKASSATRASPAPGACVRLPNSHAPASPHDRARQRSQHAVAGGGECRVGVGAHHDQARSSRPRSPGAGPGPRRPRRTTRRRRRAAARRCAPRAAAKNARRCPLSPRPARSAPNCAPPPVPAARWPAAAVAVRPGSGLPASAACSELATVHAQRQLARAAGVSASNERRASAGSARRRARPAASSSPQQPRPVCSRTPSCAAQQPMATARRAGAAASSTLRPADPGRKAGWTNAILRPSRATAACRRIAQWRGSSGRGSSP